VNIFKSNSLAHGQAVAFARQDNNRNRGRIYRMRFDHLRRMDNLLFDTHMHTRFSTDSDMLLEDALLRARQLGIGITITEHMDLAYPGEPAAFTFDTDQYFAAYNSYRSESVLLGIELGMRCDCLADNCRIAQANSFDYIIGSIHVVDNVDIYCSEFYHQRSKQEAYNLYFDAMIACLREYDFIHSLGHIDYISRYAKYQDTEIYYREFADRIDEVLRLAATRNIALEINTRRLDSKERIDIILPIYRRFAELGGTLVTIGSDAHRESEVGRRLNVGMEIAKHCGLTAVRFVNGSPLEIKA